MREPPAWTSRAACIGKPVEWWMAEQGSRKNELPPLARRALALCATCPVMNECLVESVTGEFDTFSVRSEGDEPITSDFELQGIFGGCTLQDRKATRDMAPEDRVIELRSRSQTRALQLGLTKGAA